MGNVELSGNRREAGDSWGRREDVGGEAGGVAGGERDHEQFSAHTAGGRSDEEWVEREQETEEGSDGRRPAAAAARGGDGMGSDQSLWADGDDGGGNGGTSG